MDTCAPGITAPVGSVMVPDSVAPETCPFAGLAAIVRAKMTNAKTATLCSIDIPFPKIRIICPKRPHPEALESHLQPQLNQPAARGRDQLADITGAARISGAAAGKDIEYRLIKIGTVEEVENLCPQ